MNERVRESLSALMDDEANELEVERVLSQIERDDQLRDTWVRYQHTRSALSGSALAYPAMDISTRVREALDEESAEARPEAGIKERFLRPLASLAVAASVTATVVVGGQQLAQIGGDDAYAGESIVATSASPVGLVNSLGASTVQASYGTQPLPVLLPATRQAYEELARQRMGKYMQEHAEHAALNSPQGLIPFSRVPQIRE